MNSVTKKELAETLFEKIGVSRKEAKNIVDVFFDELGHSLKRKEDINLSNFGHFEVRQKKARPGRNPRANTPVVVAPRSSVVFHASPKLKEDVEIALREKAAAGSLTP